MPMGRLENIDSFEDTQKLYRTNARLKEAVERSLTNQKLIHCIVSTFTGKIDAGRKQP